MIDVTALWRDIIAYIDGQFDAVRQGLNAGIYTILGSSIRGDIPVASVPTHASTHQNAGSDEISVAGLSGLLADQQTPVNHDHSGDAGDGGTFDAANLTSGAAADGTVLTADGAGGAAWEAVAGTGDMLYAIIQAAQLVNEIKGWPPVVPPDADLVTLNLWWDDAGTPTTKATVVDVAGEAGITETHELALKVVGDSAGDGFMQRFTYADEPRMKLGRVCSAILAIWSVSAVEVTAKLLNSDASETAAAAVTAAGWTIVKVENHTLAGTYCDLQVTMGAAGTCYVVPLGLNIGARAFPLRPRGLRYVDAPTASVVSGVDPGGAAFADLDLTVSTSPLTAAVQIVGHYRNTTTLSTALRVRRNGSSSSGLDVELCRAQVLTATYAVGHKYVPTDDGQIVEWQASGAAGDTEVVFLGVVGYWEWE